MEKEPAMADKFVIAASAAEAAALKDGDTVADMYQSIRPSALGAALELSYKTILGPLKGVVHWTDLTHRTGFYLSFGYDF